MLQLSKLAIEGFASFEQDQVFHFPDGPGFFLVTGQNKVEPDLGANGCGKTSLWNALCFVFFGKTARGLKGKDIANRNYEALTSVCCEFYLNGKLYGLTRTWNPNSIVLDPPGENPKLIQQDELEALIGCSFPLFLRSVLFGQFQSFFFDETSSEKIKALVDILNLDVWDSCTTSAKDLIKDLENGINKCGTDIAKLQGELIQLEERRTDAYERSITFEAERGESRSFLESDSVATSKELEAAEAAVKALTEDLKGIKDRADKRSTRQELTTASKKRALEVKSEIVTAIAVVEDRLRAANNRFAQFQNVVGQCPYCEQEVSEKYKEKLENTQAEHLQELKAEIKRLRIQEEGAEVKVREYDKQEKEGQRELRTYSDAKQEVEAKLSRFKTKVIVLSETLSKIRRDLSTLNEKDNVHAKELTKIVSTINDKKNKIVEREAKLSELRDNKAKTEFWVDKFKDIRLWLVEQALTELELHVNNALEELGLIGYKIKMDIERPKSDGKGIIKGFQVFITNKNTKDPIPWEAWSGGETQRLRLAGAIGLSDLITARTGFDCNIEVWDEPTEHLSEEGVSDLLTFLGTRSKVRKKQVWLVDHRSLNAGDFDGTVHIIKDETGSHIVQHQPKTEILPSKGNKNAARGSSTLRK